MNQPTAEPKVFGMPSVEDIKRMLVEVLSEILRDNRVVVSIEKKEKP